MESIREQITRRILTAMEAGVPPWRKGWEVSGTQVNATTGKPYSGLNQVLLAMTAASLPAASLPQGGDPRWLTLRQANSIGKRVRKGEHSTKIVRMVEVAKNRPEGEASSRTEVLGEEEERRLVLKVYDVFHASQIDGMEPMAPRANKMIEPGPAVDALSEGMKQTGLVILHGAQGASYLPRIDTIRVPDKAAFHTSMDYASTLLHEMSHATGHSSRLARLLPSGQFTDQERAREELRAELASAMLGGELGLPMSQQQINSHAAYLNNWHDLLANDPNEIFRAAADAQRMADYLRQVALKPEIESLKNEELSSAPTHDAPQIRM